MAGQDYTAFPKLIIPDDNQGRPFAVLAGLVDRTEPGLFREVAVDPATGAISVAVVSGGGASTPPYTHSDNSTAPALIDGLRRQVVVDVLSTPTFVLMHNAITPANVETVVPVIMKGYAAIGAQQLIVDVSIGSPGASVTLQPVVWNPLFNQYILGTPSAAITTSKRLVLPIHSPENIYLMPIAIVGTVSVAVAGV